MLPRTVDFTGLNIDPLAFFNQRGNRAVIPCDWQRIYFSSDSWIPKIKINRWLFANIQNDWVSYTATLYGKGLIAIAFENEIDAVMFRLQGGEDEIRNLTEDKE